MTKKQIAALIAVIACTIGVIIGYWSIARAMPAEAIGLLPDDVLAQETWWCVLLAILTLAFNLIALHERGYGMEIWAIITSTVAIFLLVSLGESVFAIVMVIAWSASVAGLLAGARASGSG